MTVQTGIPNSEVAGRLTIDTDALAANWRTCRDRAQGAVCSAVVKGDAYGLGIDVAVPALLAAGCDTFFVAHLSEARRTRALAPRARIHVLNGLLPGTAALYAELDLVPVLGSLPEIEEWRAFATGEGWQGMAALHVDTGMSRLGLAPAEAMALAPAALPGLGLVMSHLACADIPRDPLNARQVAAFTEVRRHFQGIPASLCNSYGLFWEAPPVFDLVRPGVALYGGNPTPQHGNPQQPVIRLEGRILQVRDVAAGESVGYGATWTSHDTARIAVIGVGYADGYLRTGSSSDDFDSAVAVVADRLCPIAGRISMDLTAVDVTRLPPGKLRRGDWVELIGKRLTVDEVGRRAGTIGYEVLTSLGTRYHRHLAPL